MTTVIKIKGRDLTPQFIRDFREKYGDSDIEIKLSDSPKSILNEDLFWEIIALLDWQEERDEDILKVAVEKLTSYPVHYIYLFQDILAEKLYSLDGEKFARHIGEDAWKEGKYFSVDNFLYARCCVIANGKEAYENVLVNPSDMPKDITFESILYLASQAYRLKNNKPFDYVPHYNYETYANKEGWLK